jgi:hypothetical protein
VTCTHTHFHAYVHASTRTSIHTYVHTYINARLHARLNSHLHARLPSSIHTSIHTSMHTSMHRPDVTYKLEAEVTECQPPRCMVVGKILTMDGQLVAEAVAKMAMMDRMAPPSDATEMPKLPVQLTTTHHITRPCPNCRYKSP